MQQLTVAALAMFAICIGMPETVRHVTAVQLFNCVRLCVSYCIVCVVGSLEHTSTHSLTTIGWPFLLTTDTAFQRGMVNGAGWYASSFLPKNGRVVNLLQNVRMRKYAAVHLSSCAFFVVCFARNHQASLIPYRQRSNFTWTHTHTHKLTWVSGSCYKWLH